MATLKSLVDETTNIKNELKTCHTNLKNNLIEKGVECSDSDKMLALINKVIDIPLEKKWATGEYNETIHASTSGFRGTAINMGLSFIPTTIVVVINKYIMYSPYYYMLNVSLSSEHANSADNPFSVSTSSAGVTTKMYISDITQDSFSIYLHSKSQGSQNITGGLTWYAYE